MTFLNEADWDRTVRILGGILLLGVGWGFATGVVGTVLIAVGLIASLGAAGVATGTIDPCQTPV
jgi:hypothetical protein